MKRRNTEAARPGVLGALRRLLNTRRPRFRVALRTPKPAATAAPSTASPQPHPPTASSNATATAASSAGLVVPAPPRDPNAEDSDASSEVDASVDGDGDNVPETKLTKKAKKKTKKRKTSTWVAKLLNQTGAPPPHRDRVFVAKHKRHKRRGTAPDSERGRAVLRGAPTALHAALLARVFAFLPPLEPARSCALVSRALHGYMAQYYERFCEWPRPRAFLAHRLLGLRHAAYAGALSRALAMLAPEDRVRASATSHAFRIAVDALPLELTGSDRATQFLQRLPPRRIARRYQETTTLCCDDVAPRDAVRLLQLMSEADDDDGEDEDEDVDRFSSVCHISLRGLCGVATETQFVALVQALFSDRISQSLRTLALTRLRLEDVHFRQLARLFYDGHFPRLEALNVSGNLFSSRFMRDWARSFHEERFTGLARLDITGVGMGVEDMERFVACLRHVPKLVVLRISHNYCCLGTLYALADVIAEHSLSSLEELSCSAVSASDEGVHVLVEALRTPGSCVALTSLDLSGNELSGGDRAMRSLADAFTNKSWPQLRCLNLSFTQPSARGFQILTRALKSTSRVRLPVRELHLAGNRLDGDAFESLVAALRTGSLRNLQLLNLSDNSLGALEFELLADCLSQDACPRVQALLLSANNAKADGITLFRRFFRAPVATTVHTLDLSGNAIPSHLLDVIVDELMKSDCRQLQVLNVSRNMAPRSVVRFQQLIRSNKCPSLACVQVGYAQSVEQGYAFVRTVRSTISVDELRRLKQLRFEARMRRIEEENVAKAARAAARCKRQTRLLREMYDHMESEADRALRRRKRVRKSPHLLIHEEIQQLKQAKYHEKVCRDLERALRGTAPSA